MRDRDHSANQGLCGHPRAIWHSRDAEYREPIAARIKEILFLSGANGSVWGVSVEELEELDSHLVQSSTLSTYPPTSCKTRKSKKELIVKPTD